MTEASKIKKLIRSSIKTDIRKGLRLIEENSDLQFVADLYLTIWNMCFVKKLNEVTVDEIHLMNIQEFPNLIPKEIKPISEIEELCLGEYPSLKLFPDILRFKKLKRLELGGNNTNRFPKEFAEFEYLEDLWFVSDNIGEIPNEIGKMKKLRKLSLSACKLRRLNEHMVELENLEELDLSYNELTCLPDWILKLPALRKLDLRNSGAAMHEIPKAGRGKIEILM